jgi:pyruvate/2-oxoacid:ferredoxin oxidoreductase alpha subunit
MAYRLAEDPEILLPVAVCYEGFYLSYLVDKVVIPTQQDVDAFFVPLKGQERIKLSTDHPMAFGRGIPFERFTEARYRHSAALGRANQKIDEIDGEFQSIFGRSYGGLIEEYKTEDAEAVLVTTGAITGTAREVIDSKRDEGLKIGLVKLRVLRPFPRGRLIASLSGKKAVGVLERDVCFGWNCGTFFMELKAALSDVGMRIPMASFIDGLGNLDVPLGHIGSAVDIISAASQGNLYNEVTWLGLE